MVGGALSIIRDLEESRGIDVVEDVIHDYADYFYPYIKDHNMCRYEIIISLSRIGRMGFAKYPLFHLYFVLGDLLGEKD